MPVLNMLVPIRVLIRKSNIVGIVPTPGKGSCGTQGVGERERENKERILRMILSGERALNKGRSMGWGDMQRPTANASSQCPTPSIVESSSVQKFKTYSLIYSLIWCVLM